MSTDNSNLSAGLKLTKSIFPVLRGKGAKIRIRHKRVCDYGLDLQVYTDLIPYDRRKRDGISFVHPTGGETTVEVTWPDGRTFAGTAVCSKSDRFDRRKGIEIAFARANAERKAATGLVKVPQIVANTVKEVKQFLGVE